MKEDKNALVLSGGGSRGGYEIGVWQALRELDVPIHIVTGTSVGAINGAMVAQNEFDLAVKLWKELETHMVFDLDSGNQSTGRLDFEVAGVPASDAFAYIKEIVTQGGAGNSGLKKLLHEYVNEDAIRSSPVEFGVVTVEFPSLKPHYLFTEDIPAGKLLNYILASAACFPAVQTAKIGNMQFVDGGYVDVLPVEMALKRGATNIIGVYLEAAGVLRKDTVQMAEEMARNVIVIKSSWDLGNFLIFDVENAKRIIRLGYLDTMKAFGVFSGSRYTFAKGDFRRTELMQADCAAKVFKLDPLIIYKKSTLHRRLLEKIALTEQTDQKSSWFSSIKALETLEDTIAAIGKKQAEAALALFAAESLRKKGDKSIFANRHAFKLFKDEIMAARYLLGNGLF